MKHQTITITTKFFDPASNFVNTASNQFIVGQMTQSVVRLRTFGGVFLTFFFLIQFGHFYCLTLHQFVTDIFKLHFAHHARMQVVSMNGKLLIITNLSTHLNRKACKNTLSNGGCSSL